MASRVSVVVLLYVAVVAKMMITMSKAGGAGDGAIFIFGDSLADVGTNNFLNDTGARADHRYYGIDFPYHLATGRFSNGYNSIDFLVRYMSDHYNFTPLSPPPFLALLNRSATFQRNLLGGANFASAGSGILSDTGRLLFGHVISLLDQIQQFATVRGNITDLLGGPLGVTFLQNSTYIITAGSNDLLEHQQDLVEGRISPEQLLTNLTTTYATHLQNLYDLGARKFGIIGIPPLGCSPAERVLNMSWGGDGGCVNMMNDLAQSFYASIESLLQNFTSTNQGVIYALGNALRIVKDMIDNPRGSGFKVVETACCGNGTFNGQTFCQEGTNLCNDRKDYLFWDLFHPTQAAAQEAALSLAYAEGTEFVTPMNFSSLAKA